MPEYTDEQRNDFTARTLELRKGQQPLNCAAEGDNADIMAVFTLPCQDQTQPLLVSGTVTNFRLKNRHGCVLMQGLVGTDREPRDLNLPGVIQGTPMDVLNLTFAFEHPIVNVPIQPGETLERYVTDRLARAVNGGTLLEAPVAVLEPAHIPGRKLRLED